MSQNTKPLTYIVPLSPVQSVWLVAADGSLDGPHPAAAIAHHVETDQQVPVVAAVLVLAQRATWTDGADTYFDQARANQVSRDRSAQPIAAPTPAGRLTTQSLSRKS